MCTVLQKASAKLYVRTKRLSKSGNRTWGIWSGGTSELPTELMHLTHYSPNIPHHLNTIIKIKWHVQPIWHTCSLFLYCYGARVMCTVLQKASAKLYVRTKRFSNSGNRTRHLKWWYLGVTNWANASEVLAPEYYNRHVTFPSRISCHEPPTNIYNKQIKRVPFTQTLILVKELLYLLLAMYKSHQVLFITLYALQIWVK